MKITALAIHEKEFNHGLRGYREDDVDDFLDGIAAEVDRLTKENEALTDRFREAETKIAGLDSERNAINSALLIAQRSADELMLKAESDHTKIIKDGEKRASEIIHEALSQKRELLSELKRLKSEEERFRKGYIRLLEDSRASVEEVRLSDSVMAVLSQKEQSYASAVAKASSQPEQDDPEIEFEADFGFEQPELVEVEAVEVQEFDAAPQPEPAPVIPQHKPVQHYEAPAPVIPTSSPKPRTEGLIIGEVGADVPVDTRLVDPHEYTIPGGDRWGDREDDLDIEEID
ncbi:MAG: DivIVA domain-containing protein [Coriobacteriia bacterium]|nr:DivIVA domain-containing protein [Coriobacteriia bacterium]